MREKEKVTRVIFIRHGITDFPIDRIYRDEVEDPELNELGKFQAENASKFFEREKISRIYCSPSLRTRMTAEPTVKVCGAEIVYNENLKERHFGNLEGLYFKEIEENFPNEFKSWKTDPIGFKPVGGESVFDIQKRVRGVVDSIIEAHPGETVIVVSHVGPIRMIVCDAFKIPVELYRQLSIDNASLTRIDYGKKQNNFIYMNNIYENLSR